MIKRAAVFIAVCVLFSTALTGCTPSKKKVESSSYYKELKKENKKLKKEKEKLEEELAYKDEPSEDERRASDYLAKIARDRIISIEVGYADNMEGGELIQDKTLFPAATALAKRADLTGKYTPEEISSKYGPGYEYILYDEDNAVYEIMVYQGNYVVFTDLPNNVYYAYNASALGDACLHYRDGYPNSKLLHRLADSALVTDGKNCYENDSATRAANFIRTMDKERTSRTKAEKAWQKEKKTLPEGQSYIFRHHGNSMTMTLYDDYICLKNMDEKETWYKAARKDISALKKAFVVPAEEVEDGGDDRSGSSSSEDQSHEKEIEEESSVSETEE